jgi:hypothetical protein
MMTVGNLRRATTCVTAIATLLALQIAAARAQSTDVGNAIFGGIFKGIQSGVAAAAWKGVDPQTQSCLASQYNMNVNDLISQGILPNDSRVAPDIQACQAAAQNQAAPAQQQASLPPQESPAKPDKAELIRKYGRKTADLILAGQIAKGWNEEEVSLAWGEPSDKDTSVPGQELWNYGNDKVVFTRGKVTDVTH